MAALGGIMDKMNATVGTGSGHALLAGKVSIDTKKTAADYAILWTGIQKSCRFFLHDILGATLSLTKWSALTGVFAGLLAPIMQRFDGNAVHASAPA